MDSIDSTTVGSPVIWERHHVEDGSFARLQGTVPLRCTGLVKGNTGSYFDYLAQQLNRAVASIRGVRDRIHGTPQGSYHPPCGGYAMLGNT